MIVAMVMLNWSIAARAQPDDSTTKFQTQVQPSEAPHSGIEGIPSGSSVPSVSPTVDPSSDGLNRDQDWTQRYARGNAIATTGVKMGRIGVVTIVGGLTFWAAQNSIYSYGSTAAGLGALIAWMGAGVAQYGTSKSHAALMDGAVVHNKCVGCFVSWAALTPHPITAVAGVPSSFLISGAHRNRLAAQYSAHQRHRAGHRPAVSLTPMPSGSAPGVNLSGRF